MAKRGRGRPRKTPLREGAEFFKVFLPQLCSHQLLIPPDFIKDFSRTINEKVILKDIGGRQWHVDVQRTPNGVFLRDGWPSFVDYHCLEVGEFLVFKYDGNYSFVVTIFGTNACKKVPFATKNIATHVKTEETSEEEIEAKQNSHGKRSRENVDDLKIADRVNVPPYFISNPNQSDPYKLQIPEEVVDRHNLDLEGEMALRTVDGKEWPVNFYSVKDGRTYMGKGWWSFQKDNNMGPKDSCIFTFQKERSSTTINVKILRAKVW